MRGVPFADKIVSFVTYGNSIFWGEKQHGLDSLKNKQKAFKQFYISKCVAEV